MKKLVLAALSAGAVFAASESAWAQNRGSYIANYRDTSFSLTSGMDIVLPVFGPGDWNGLSTNFGPNNAVGIIGLGANARAVVSGFQFGFQMGVSFIDQATSDAILSPGFSFGYVIPLTNRVGLTPSFRSVFLMSTADNSSAIVQMTGELGLPIFLGYNGFMEPVLALGDLQFTGLGTSGEAVFIFGIGYRLGVVF